ncbi:hypothetical protein FRC03_005421, partial [Tulasnella sp. 419]
YTHSSPNLPLLGTQDRVPTQPLKMVHFASEDSSLESIAIFHKTARPRSLLAVDNNGESDSEVIESDNYPFSSSSSAIGCSFDWLDSTYIAAPKTLAQVAAVKPGSLESTGAVEKDARLASASLSIGEENKETAKDHTSYNTQGRLKLSSYASPVSPTFNLPGHSRSRTVGTSIRHGDSLDDNTSKDSEGGLKLDTKSTTSAGSTTLSSATTSTTYSDYNSSLSEVPSESPEDTVWRAKSLCDSALIFQQSAFDIAELAELRICSFMAWSAVNERQHDLQTTAEYESWEDEIAAHERMEAFLSSKERMCDRLRRDLALVTSLLSATGEGMALNYTHPADTVIVFIMAWIVLLDSTEVMVATTPQRREALNKSFLKAIGHDIMDLANNTASLSSRHPRDARAGDRNLLELKLMSVCKQLFAAFMELVHARAGLENLDLISDNTAPHTRLLKAAILHSPWLGDDQRLKDSIEGVNHRHKPPHQLPDVAFKSASLEALNLAGSTSSSPWNRHSPTFGTTESSSSSQSERPGLSDTSYQKFVERWCFFGSSQTTTHSSPPSTPPPPSLSVRALVDFTDSGSGGGPQSRGFPGTGTSRARNPAFSDDLSDWWLSKGGTQEVKS